jgi:hypothetical protein
VAVVAGLLVEPAFGQDAAERQRIEHSRSEHRRMTEEARASYERIAPKIADVIQASGIPVDGLVDVTGILEAAGYPPDHATQQCFDDYKCAIPSKVYAVAIPAGCSGIAYAASTGFEDVEQQIVWLSIVSADAGVHYRVAQLATDEIIEQMAHLAREEIGC